MKSLVLLSTLFGESFDKLHGSRMTDNNIFTMTARPLIMDIRMHVAVNVLLKWIELNNRIVFFVLVLPTIHLIFHHHIRIFIILVISRYLFYVSNTKKPRFFVLNYTNVEHKVKIIRFEQFFSIHAKNCTMMIWFHRYLLFFDIFAFIILQKLASIWWNTLQFVSSPFAVHSMVMVNIFKTNVI